MIGPPEKKRGDRLAPITPTDFECVTRYNAQRVAQAIDPWFHEAERISREFHRTGNTKHLRAFCRQISGIMAEVEGSLQR